MSDLIFYLASFKDYTEVIVIFSALVQTVLLLINEWGKKDPLFTFALNLLMTIQFAQWHWWSTLTSTRSNSDRCCIEVQKYFLKPVTGLLTTAIIFIYLFCSMRPHWRMKLHGRHTNNKWANPQHMLVVFAIWLVAVSFSLFGDIALCSWQRHSRQNIATGVILRGWSCVNMLMNHQRCPRHLSFSHRLQLSSIIMKPCWKSSF